MNSSHHAMVAVAIDKDKSSQGALKWVVDNLSCKDYPVILVHVDKNKRHHRHHNRHQQHNSDEYINDLILPFRCFCMRKDVQCNNVVLEGSDIAKAIAEFVQENVVHTLVIGATTKSSFLRFKTGDTPNSIMKVAPDFCTVYIISKGKISSARKALRPPPALGSPLHLQIHPPSHTFEVSTELENNTTQSSHHSRRSIGSHETPSPFSQMFDGKEMRSPFLRESNMKSYIELGLMNSTDISFVSSDRPSTEQSSFPSFYNDFDGPRLSRSSNISDMTMEMMRMSPRMSIESDLAGNPYSPFTREGGTCTTSSSSPLAWNNNKKSNMEDMEAEMRRLKLELSKTMEMYNNACKEAITAQKQTGELNRWKREEEQRLKEARRSEEAALAMVEKEREKRKNAVEEAKAALRLAEMEAKKRIQAERKACLKVDEKRKTSIQSNDGLIGSSHLNIGYRKYTIQEIEVATNNFSADRKVGEGGYGPVFKGCLDHTPVAIKVLRPDAAQGRTQFKQEVQVLCCMRHPNMVLLLGACPEYGCLVYEYLDNGSLEDRLFCKGSKTVLPWQLRFRISAEIATALLFLHQSKPEPLVHRDLKPGNILLDRNYVSKISDVGLARLVPPNVADSVTQYRMTSTAGTLCYIDPEYQQTGMLGTKSDIYSFGVMLLQIVTGKPPTGLTHYVAQAIKRGTLESLLDPKVKDWPIEEAMNFAKLALQCTELRRKDRPDLGSVVLPELNRLRQFGNENMPQHDILDVSNNSSPIQTEISITNDLPLTSN